PDIPRTYDRHQPIHQSSYQGAEDSALLVNIRLPPAEKPHCFLDRVASRHAREGLSSSQRPYGLRRERRSSRNSIRTFGSCRKLPSMQLVTASEFCFSMPRIIMHM